MMAIVAWVDGVFWDDRGRMVPRAVHEAPASREVDMVHLWDDLMGVRHWDAGPEGSGTVIYRGAELVRDASGAVAVWWLPISGHEGRIGTAPDLPRARRLVDDLWRAIEDRDPGA